jgi:hypothetical protein
MTVGEKKMRRIRIAITIFLIIMCELRIADWINISRRRQGCPINYVETMNILDIFEKL